VSGKKWLLLGVFGLALVANPYLACSSNESQSDFTYSEAEMKSVVLGAWQGSAQLDGEAVPFSLVLEQASGKSKTQSLSAPALQPQCGSRSFVKPAAACVSSTGMPVVGTLSSINPALDGAVDGTLTAYRTLDSVRLELRLDSGTMLYGTLEDEAVTDGRISASQSDSFSLTRP
jgi:hypothetical protein